MDQDDKKAFNDLCIDFDESMKRTLNILSEIFSLVDSLKRVVKVEELPKTTGRKRVMKKEKKVVAPTPDIITLNADAPIADHHSGDKGKGEIEFIKLE
jgi:hypothetical protein